MQKLVAFLRKLTRGEFNERYPYACPPFPGSNLYGWVLKSGKPKSHDDFYSEFQSMGSPSINMGEIDDLEFTKCFNSLS
jgi:hypothetical protein